IGDVRVVPMRQDVPATVRIEVIQERPDAGASRHGALLDGDWSTFESMIRINVTTPLWFDCAFRVSADACADWALAGFDRGVPLGYPGRAYRAFMTARLPSRSFAPRWARPACECFLGSLAP